MLLDGIGAIFIHGVYIYMHLYALLKIRALQGILRGRFLDKPLF